MGYVAIALVALGLALSAVLLLSGRKTRLVVSQRVATMALTSAPRLSIAPRERPWLVHVEAFADRAFRYRMRKQWGVRSHGRRLLMTGLIASGGAGLVCGVLLKLPPGLVAIVTVLAFVTVPRITMLLQQTKAEAQFTEAFPGALDSIIRMLRAGLPISAVIRSVGSDSKSALTSVFAAIADQVDVGVPLTDALAESAKHIDLPDFRFFSVAVALQHSTGGNLTVTLDTLSEIVRKRRVARMRGRSVTAEVRMTAYVLAVIPFIIVGGLLAVNPGYLSPLIHDPRGNVIAALAVGSLMFGFLTMHLMMRSATRM